MTVFLDLNGYTTTVDDDALVSLTLEVAENRISKEQAMERLRSMVSRRVDSDVDDDASF
jgi:prophage maintenance system killer protein